MLASIGSWLSRRSPRAMLLVAQSSMPQGAIVEPPIAGPVEQGAWRRSHRRTISLAALASLALHFFLLTLVARFPLPATGRTLLEEVRATLSPDAALEEPLPEPSLALANPEDDEETEHQVLVAERMSAAPVESPVAEPEAVDELQIDEAPVELASAQAVPAAKTLDDMLARPGGAGEQVASVEGAVDRVAYEIITALEEHQVLVVWLLDASNSLVAQREAVALRLERIYGEIAQAAQITHDASLLSAVCSFGLETSELLAPTADVAAVSAAMRQVGNDASGVENVFSAVADVAARYRAHRVRDHRHTMIVIWTDESGDDLDALEDAVDLCRRAAIPVFTVGPAAMFGRRQGVQAYRHPENGRWYQLPVDRGPDTARQELLRLPYWFEGDQLSLVSSGVGPFALTRLARESGGAYFINDTPAERGPISLASMRPYLPEYAAPQEYLKHVKRSPLRQAVLRAVDLTYERELKGTPRLEFAPTGENFQRELGEAQETAAYNLHTINLALAAFGSDGMERQYERESSPRWRAWYDLTRGRLLAMWVRATEYNWACAVMKGKGADFVDKKSNRWQFQPSPQLNFGTTSLRYAEESQRLLRRCLRENAETPWALLAERELRHPFGFTVAEAYVAPPPPPRRAPNDTNPPAPGRSEETLRKLPRETAVELPKL